MFVVGRHQFSSPVFLAPMSGATDAAFRRQASRLGASAVVTEMIASGELTTGGEDAARRLHRFGDEKGPFIVQLAGREAEWMEKAAQIACDAGASIIDINMGCPARKVTGGLSGAALMRDLDRARELIRAVIRGANCPVTLKMRLGWDDQDLNAPQLGKIAEDEGVAMLTVHGRTRCQFYEGHADWIKIREVVEQVDLPVLANGDINDTSSASGAIDASGAHGVMVGRSAIGRPWLPGVIARGLSGQEEAMPTLDEKLQCLAELIEDCGSLYGAYLGVRVVRKHISEFVATDAPIPASQARVLKGRLCRISDLDELRISVLSMASSPEWSKEVEPC